MGELSNTRHRLFSAGLKALVFAVAMGAAGTVAWAQPDDQSSDGQDARARALYKEADADYAAGRYEEAAAKFTEAYELSKRSALLFNVANAYERMGEYQKAADNLKRYLKGPKVKDVVSVRERIRRLEAAVTRQQEEEAAAAARKAEAERATAARARENVGTGPDGDIEPERTVPTERAVPVAAAQKSDRGKSRFSRQRQVYALAGTSAIALVGTVAFGLAARSAASDAEPYCLGAGGLCRDEAKGALQRETQYAVLADLSLGVAVITAGTSLYLLLRSGNKRKPEQSASRIIPFFMPSGLGLGVSGAL